MKEAGAASPGPIVGTSFLDYLRTTRVLAAMSPRRWFFEEIWIAIKPTRYAKIPSMRRSTVLMAAAPRPAGAPKDPGTRSLVVGYPTGAA